MRRALILVALFCLSVLAGAAWSWHRFVSVPVALPEEVALAVEPGEAAASVARRLESAGIVRNGRALLLLARLRGADREFRHGEHRFAGSLKPDDVLAELVRNTESSFRVTIPEGFTLREIANLLEEKGLANASSFREAACRSDIVELAGAAPSSHCVEGFLFPDTYDLAPQMSAEDIVRTQLGRFRSVARRVLAELPDGFHNTVVPPPADGVRVTGVLADEPAQTALLRAVVTLASIIEKETGVEAERGVVASVFHNRLRRGMRLQADPTVVYGLELTGVEWDRARLHEYLREPGPYNTYTEGGLPPGPICNPGEEALRAALAPEKTDYLYFVANQDGTHRFSRTLAEHNRAVADVRRRSRPAS